MANETVEDLSSKYRSKEIADQIFSRVPPREEQGSLKKSFIHRFVSKLKKTLESVSPLRRTYYNSPSEPIVVG